MALIKITFVVLALLNASNAGEHYCGYSESGPTATIDAGVVIGTTTSLPSATATVNKFLGVPFAKSPPTRFAPPVRPAPFSGPIEAKEWSPACIQQFVYPKEAQEFTEFVFNNPAPEESEDCLYVDYTFPNKQLILNTCSLQGI